MERKFGRLVSFDARSRLYPIKKLTTGLSPVNRVWYCGKTLDQGSEGSCVGHGIAHDLISEPTPMLWVDHKFAIKLYNGAKDNDEWPGSDYNGTSVLGGLKYGKSIGLFTGWNWSFTHLDTQIGIGHAGPGIAGTNWYTGMIKPDSKGFLHVTGENEGGHCYLYIGVNIEDEYFIIRNSWGRDWGDLGDAKISFDNYEKLRTNNGEMAFLVGETDTGGANPPGNGGCSIAKSWVNLGNWMARIVGSKTQITIRR